MNWKLIFLLSLFGLAMAVGTVYVIQSKIEPWCWLAIFIVCAWAIAARAPGKFFLHGFLVGIVNSVWVTAAHVLLYDPYIAHHSREAQMIANGPMAHPRVMMAIVGPIVGILSGLVLGLFAWIASKLVRSRGAA
ncbi:MAG TPA: hypothetical protein VEO74_00475 [Thermoanaerobaculia bacterium]|nr:hypothetical protein [Thermoanaerobaculia bacterium]